MYVTQGGGTHYFQTKEKILRKRFFRMERLVKQIPSETFANKKNSKKYARLFDVAKIRK